MLPLRPRSRSLRRHTPVVAPPGENAPRSQVYMKRRPCAKTGTYNFVNISNSIVAESPRTYTLSNGKIVRKNHTRLCLDPPRPGTFGTPGRLLHQRVFVSPSATAAYRSSLQAAARQTQTPQKHRSSPTTFEVHPTPSPTASPVRRSSRVRKAVVIPGAVPIAATTSSAARPPARRTQWVKQESFSSLPLRWPHNLSLPTLTPWINRRLFPILHRLPPTLMYPFIVGASTQNRRFPADLYTRLTVADFGHAYKKPALPSTWTSRILLFAATSKSFTKSSIGTLWCSAASLVGLRILTTASSKLICYASALSYPVILCLVSSFPSCFLFPLRLVPLFRAVSYLIISYTLFNFWGGVCYTTAKLTLSCCHYCLVLFHCCTKLTFHGQVLASAHCAVDTPYITVKDMLIELNNKFLFF